MFITQIEQRSKTTTFFHHQMKTESVLKFLIGSKYVGSSFPVLVVLGDHTHNDSPFGEHYIFVNLPNFPFLVRRHVLSPQNARMEFFDFKAYPNLFSAEALIQQQISAARDHLENSLSTYNKDIQRMVFWNGYPFEFVQAKENPLLYFKAFGHHADAIKQMFNFTHCKRLQDFEEKVSKTPAIKVREETIK